MSISKEAKAAMAWRFRARIHEVYVRDESLPSWITGDLDRRLPNRKLHVHLVLDAAMADDVTNALLLAMRTGEPLILTSEVSDD